MQSEALKTRRKLVALYRRLAVDTRFKPAERAQFARMADAWGKSLSNKR